MSIDELAENMRSVLAADGVSNYQRIVFVSHSMGGLVTRAYLLKNRNIAEHTLFAYFFSTPTTGSQIASIAQYLSSNPQLTKMKLLKAEDYLADLLRQWLSASFSFPSYCAYEKRPTKGVSLVVNMDSAVALCTKAVGPIDTDHIGIVKPASQNSASYIAFKAAYADGLRTLLKPIDNKISFNCLSEPRPTRARPDKVMHSLQIIEPYTGELLPASVAHILMPPGDREIKNEPHTAPDWVVRCTLTNYAEVPFFRVSVPFVVEWREVAKTQNGTTSGSVIATLAAQSPPLDIGIGARNEDYFYIENFSLYWVLIAFPETAWVYEGGDAVAREAKLIPPNMWMPLSLQPNPYRKPAPPG